MPPKKGQARGGKGDNLDGQHKGAYKGEDRGDRKGAGRSKGGPKGVPRDEGGKKGSRGKGDFFDDYDDPYGDGGMSREGRSQLNSNAPDFKPAGFPYGGMYSPSDMQRLWGWQPPGSLQMPPLWREYADENGTPYYYNSKTGLSQWERPSELDPPKPPPPPEGASAADRADRGREKDGPSPAQRDGKGDDREDQPRRRDADGGGRDRDSGRGDAGRGDAGRGDAGRDRDRDGGPRNAARGNKRRGGGKPDDGAAKKKEGSEFGPPGCNLFVFHLPDDWTDDDLHEYFAPHGNVVSAKVMKELGTGRSRGFGFVSYEDRVSAATAIKKMQGYKILGKRLKVEFKKGEQDGWSSKENDRGGDRSEDEEGGNSRKSYPDDERLIGYLRAISAKNVVMSLKESEGSRPQEDAPVDDDGEFDQ